MYISEELYLPVQLESDLGITSVVQQGGYLFDYALCSALDVIFPGRTEALHRVRGLHYSVPSVYDS